MHSRNQHKQGYDFKALITTLPALSEFTIVTPRGDTSIDFANKTAVKTLNKALLQHHYGVKYWDIADEFLCPPVPGRADYIHGIADLLECDMTCKQDNLCQIYGLDIGTGANVIYPLIGNAQYKWQFIGSDINLKAVKSAQTICTANKLPIKVIHQPNAEFIFKNVIMPNQTLHFSMCNPPFHSSEKAASAGTQRKWKNLGKTPPKTLNFGGHAPELWCTGGELRFIKTMINESRLFSQQCVWFTSLVSNKDNLQPLKKALNKLQPVEVKVIKMAQGQKQSRFIAWTFINREQRKTLLCQ
ncbi:23S rRNA (adenine(1618)-N(6))-methyltransferase RlmF [Pseudoalteromonas sp. MMG013]|uniref:23S rRNA (adenine(1618)-N(6))-methyltransferase RlmF n=1 Tax=Pseudoalteromonas sp. MMG013 TaxID=2822687 RepID=UPI001B399A68|nr:23S rRNA (adenine(1618)-N(6))-methyltransferase RlmF [Pseudoalteromonas sp. MMG013]MBQ4860137.1 23S rRNA (adenine(1618)-N(6))-methyltransferase RlmF [Pseudoalteromonas sp. MMG013]